MRDGVGYPSRRRRFDILLVELLSAAPTCCRWVRPTKVPLTKCQSVAGGRGIRLNPGRRSFDIDRQNSARCCKKRWRCATTAEVARWICGRGEHQRDGLSPPHLPIRARAKKILIGRALQKKSARRVYRNDRKNHVSDLSTCV